MVAFRCTLGRGLVEHWFCLFSQRFYRIPRNRPLIQGNRPHKYQRHRRHGQRNVGPFIFQWFSNVSLWDPLSSRQGIGMLRIQVALPGLAEKLDLLVFPTFLTIPGNRPLNQGNRPLTKIGPARKSLNFHCF